VPVCTNLDPCCRFLLLLLDFLRKFNIIIPTKSAAGLTTYILVFLEIRRVLVLCDASLRSQTYIFRRAIKSNSITDGLIVHLLFQAQSPREYANGSHETRCNPTSIDLVSQLDPEEQQTRLVAAQSSRKSRFCVPWVGKGNFSHTLFLSDDPSSTGPCRLATHITSCFTTTTGVKCLRHRRHWVASLSFV